MRGASSCSCRIRLMRYGGPRHYICGCQRPAAKRAKRKYLVVEGYYGSCAQPTHGRGASTRCDVADAKGPSWRLESSGRCKSVATTVFLRFGFSGCAHERLERQGWPCPVLASTLGPSSDPDVTRARCVSSRGSWRCHSDERSGAERCGGRARLGGMHPGPTISLSPPSSRDE